jgi:hypothetical protein
MEKRCEYKVYTAAGVYIKTWTDVTSELSLPEEINTSGSQVTVQLGRGIDNFGEGDDITLDNQVKIYIFDNDDPNGRLVFHGYIAGYTPFYTENAGLEVLLYNYGLQLSNQSLDLGNPIVQDIFTTYVGSNYLAQTFTPDTDIYVQSISVWLRANLTNPSQWTPTMKIGTGIPSSFQSDPSLATKVGTEVNSQSWSEFTFTFDEAVLLSAGVLYNFKLVDLGVGVSPTTWSQVQASDLSSYTDGLIYYSIASGVVDGSYDPQYSMRFSINGGTELNFNSFDPSDMLRKIIDTHQVIGNGTVSYDATTIDDTGYLASYDFGSMTLWECIKKCLELAPPDWYVYIDQGTNLLHFHEKTSAYDHRFVLGQHISALKPEKTNRNTINTVYFTGGDGFYKKYVHGTPSVTRAANYIDKRVTREATADIIANTILQSQAPAQVRLEVTILDRSINSDKGYDIDSIVVGSNGVFRGFTTSTTSLFDVAQFDLSYFDYNLAEMETFVLQIVRIDRRLGEAVIMMSTVPPDVSKRIEDINRRLVQEQTVDNPAVPTVT